MDWNPGWAFSFRTAGGETIGPVRSAGFCVHSAARASVGMAGGTATVLRAAEGCWRVVAGVPECRTE